MGKGKKRKKSKMDSYFRSGWVEDYNTTKSTDLDIKKESGFWEDYKLDFRHVYFAVDIFSKKFKIPN